MFFSVSPLLLPVLPHASSFLLSLSLSSILALFPFSVWFLCLGCVWSTLICSFLDPLVFLFDLVCVVLHSGKHGFVIRVVVCLLIFCFCLIFVC